MNSAEYVDQQIQEMKASGMDLSLAAWKAAQLTIGWPYVFGGRGENCTPGNRRVRYNKTAAGKNKDNIRDKCQVLKGTKAECNGCKWYPNGKRVRSFDCRGFTYWILLQIYGWKLMGAGATSQWNNAENWKAKGLVAAGIPQGVIACLFYPEKSDPKKMAHTGLYYNGETCECSSGVQHSKTLNSKWTHWAVPACVEGDTPTPTPPDPERKPTLRKGDKGPYVTLAQTELINRGYDLGKWGADGQFGAQTEKAVKAFQKDHDGPDGRALKVDGIIGQDTWWALDSTEPTVYYTVTIPHVTQKQAEGLCAQWSGAEMKKEE